MRIVLDNNILFSLMNPSSANSYLFSLIKAEFFAPDYIKLELEEHKEECLIKSNLSEQEFDMRLEEVESKIRFVNLNEYKHFLKDAIESLVDVEDSPYLALSLFLNAKIWSNDKHLKQQSLVEVYNTSELIEKMLEGEI